jgi:hypothetical protein
MKADELFDIIEPVYGKEVACAGIIACAITELYKKKPHKIARKIGEALWMFSQDTMILAKRISDVAWELDNDIGGLGGHVTPTLKELVDDGPTPVHTSCGESSD